MSHSQLLQVFLQRRLFAILRAPTAEGLVDLAGALVSSGIPTIEIALTTPDGLSILRHIREAYGERVIVGAGTVLDPETARAAIDAGAEFLVAPTFSPAVIGVAKRYGKLSIPGAFTPTEILAAWDAGADFVKVFPVDAVGPAYLRSVARPLPQIRMLATGNISADAAGEFLNAGACGVGIGGPLCDPTAAAAGRFGEAASLAKRYVEVVQTRRAAPCL